MAKLADAYVSEAYGETLGGSNPLRGTFYKGGFCMSERERGGCGWILGPFRRVFVQGSTEPVLSQTFEGTSMPVTPDLNTDKIDEIVAYIERIKRFDRPQSPYGYGHMTPFRSEHGSIFIAYSINPEPGKQNPLRSGSYHLSQTEWEELRASVPGLRLRDMGANE